MTIEEIEKAIDEMHKEIESMVEGSPERKLKETEVRELYKKYYDKQEFSKWGEESETFIPSNNE